MSWRSGSSRRDSCSVQSRLARSSGTWKRRAARSRNSASKSALWAVNSAPSRRPRSSARTGAAAGAPRKVRRVMPWMRRGPTRLHGHGRRINVDHWSAMVPSGSTVTSPICRMRWRVLDRPDVSTSTTANRGSATSTTLHAGCQRPVCRSATRRSSWAAMRAVVAGDDHAAATLGSTLGVRASMRSSVGALSRCLAAA